MINMKLEYLDTVNANGDNVIRLYEFDSFQADKFKQQIKETILVNNKTLSLSMLDFIQPINCNLTFRISNTDNGITTNDKKQFFCDLTTKAYEEMVLLLEPFCKDNNGYQWLYDTNSKTELLFSPDGKW
jgi:hypothetical protein